MSAILLLLGDWPGLQIRSGILQPASPTHLTEIKEPT
jgi:hypothetical protein